MTRCRNWNARCASSTSDRNVRPFGKSVRVGGFGNRNTWSNRSIRLANARAVTVTVCSTTGRAISTRSLRTRIAFVSAKSISRTAVRRNAHFFAFDSIKMVEPYPSSRCRQAITKPGNPAPEPRSTTSSSLSTSSAICHASKTCRFQTSSTVPRPIKFILDCHFTRSVSNARNRRSVSRETLKSASGKSCSIAHLSSHIRQDER